MDAPQPNKSCPPGAGAVAVLIGLSIVLFGIIAPASQFPNGRWLPILVGFMLTLAGVQILRISVFHQAAGGIGTSIIAICIYFAFSAVLFWGAFSDGIIENKDGHPAKYQWLGHTIFGILALAAFVGAILFIQKLVGQLKNRQ